LFNRLDVFRWIEMIMKVDRWHIFRSSELREESLSQPGSLGSRLSLNLFYHCRVET
jgi:hypothetical protein